MNLFRSEEHVDRWLAGRPARRDDPGRAAQRARPRLVAPPHRARLAAADGRREPGDPRRGRAHERLLAARPGDDVLRAETAARVMARPSGDVCDAVTEG